MQQIPSRVFENARYEYDGDDALKAAMNDLDPTFSGARGDASYFYYEVDVVDDTPEEGKQ
jgi:hypothetical protein